MQRIENFHLLGSLPSYVHILGHLKTQILCLTEQPNPASCLRRKFRVKSATDKNFAWNK